MATVKKPKVSPNLAKRLRNFLQSLRGCLSKILHFFCIGLKILQRWTVVLATLVIRILQSLRSCLSKILHFFCTGWQTPQKWAVVLAILVVVILVLAYCPHTHPFEGRLIVKEFSFTIDKEDTLFLKNVDIKSLNISGRQKFKLSNADEKTEVIDLDEESGQWILTSKSNLVIKELRLGKGAIISNIQFSPYSKTLSFTIETGKPAHLTFSSGDNNVVSVLGGIPRTFNLLSSEFDFDIDLPEKIIVRFELTNSDDQIFWGELNAKNVKFKSAIENHTNYPDRFEESTIVGGTIRMAKKTLTLHGNQFLLVEDEETDIEVLHNIRILNSQNNNNTQLTKPIKGIELSLSGRTKKIQIGINSRLPIEEISGGWLIKFIPSDMIALIVGALFGIIAALISSFPGKTSRNVPD